MNTRAYLAELLGTFLFMMIGYASVAAFRAAGDPPVPSLLVVPFAFGLGLLGAIYAFGHASGGHFNPAVTVAMVLDGRTTPADAVGYIVAQVVGAIGAAAVILVTVLVQGSTLGPLIRWLRPEGFTILHGDTLHEDEARARMAAAQLAEAGAKRLSVGGALSRLALAAFVKGARAMKEQGSFAWMGDMMSIAEARRMFAAGTSRN